MLVFTNGVFDLLHRGHVAYLSAARALGGHLIVGINSDASVRQLGKGLNRPINCGFDRAAVVSALASVDRVVMFDEATPMRLLKALRPAIYVKGGDYDMDALPEAELVRSWGGKAISIPFLAGYSSTSIIARIRA